MNTSLSREEVVYRLQREFSPLECVIKIGDHETELSFWVLDVNGSPLISVECIPMSNLQDPRRLDSIASQASAFLPFCAEKN